VLALGALAAAVIAFVVIVSGGGGGGSSGSTTPTTATTAKATKAKKHTKAASKPQAFRVGRLTLTLLEPSSAGIASVKTASGTPARQLITSVRYPAVGTPNGKENSHAIPAQGPFPLIVFSQGYNTNDSAYAWLMDKWTSAGYVVAAPTYPFTAPTSSGGPNETDIVNHPADLRFVISTLLKNSGQTAAVRRLFNPSKIAVIGQSDGGDVSLAVVANSCCRIKTVKAAVILSGAELARFGGSYFSGGSVPLLAVQGSADTINPPGCSKQFYDQAPQPKYYLDLIGASHLSPYTLPGSDRSTVAAATAAFLDRYLKGRQSAATTLKHSGTVAGVAALTNGSTAPGASTTCPGAP
jgi:predicted dienelactone hydrolase